MVPLLRVVVVLHMIALLAPASASAADSEPPAPTVVVVDPRPVDVPGRGPRALRAAVTDAIKGQSASVVPPSELTAAQLACETIACFRGISQVTGASFVVRIDAVGQNDDYELQLHLWAAATGQLLSSDRLNCRLCTAAEIVKFASDQATALFIKGTAARAAAPAAPKTDLGSSAGIIAVAPGNGAPVTAAPAKRWPAVAIAVAGGIAAATGAVLLLGAGVQSECDGVSTARCGRNVNYRTAGWVTGAAGAAVLITGAIFAVRGRF